jgi:hypothetical protein
MDFTQQTQTKADAPLYKLLAGDQFHVYDYTVGASQTLVAGRVVGFNTATSQVVALSTSVVTDTLSGNGSTTTFDLTSAAVDPATVQVLVAGAAVYDFTISRGTGTAGVDQIVFGTAPATGASNIKVRYKLSTATPIGVLLEDVTTGVGATAIKPVLVAGPVKLSSIVTPPATWNVGMVVGQLILR